jgi:hypothetical protein
MNSQSNTQTRAAEANKVKEIIVRTMISEGYISKDRGDDFLAKYAIVEHSQGWLGATIDRFIKNKAEAFYRIVKILH